MSNQGWAPPPRSDENKTTGEKVFDVVTWPFRKVFGFIAVRVLTKLNPRNRR